MGNPSADKMADKDGEKSADSEAEMDCDGVFTFEILGPEEGEKEEDKDMFIRDIEGFGKDLRVNEVIRIVE